MYAPAKTKRTFQSNGYVLQKVGIRILAMPFLSTLCTHAKVTVTTPTCVCTSTLASLFSQRRCRGREILPPVRHLGLYASGPNRSKQRRKCLVGDFYKRRGGFNWMVVGCPVIFVQIVRGSAPICSLVAPLGMESTFPGTVTGMGTPHLFPVAVVTVTLLMESPSFE
jgi:hypothetical protein